MEHFPGLPPGGSAHASEIDLLIGLVHWFILALFLAWGLYFLYAIVRFRASRQKKADYRGPKGRWILVSVAAVVTVELILDFGFSIPIWSKRVERLPSEEDATVVRIVAEQYAWNVHYPGPDGIFGTALPGLVDADNPLGIDRSEPVAMDDIVLLNRLIVPVDRPVLIYLTSRDVIHSLSLPVFRVKQDAVPGLTIPVWFLPERTTDEIRSEMETRFDVGAAVATETSLPLPPAREIDISVQAGSDDDILLADCTDRDGAVVAYAGDALSAPTVRLLIAAGLTTVRVREKTELDMYISMERYADSEGGDIVAGHEPLSADAVSRLVNAGVGAVKARARSAVEPWMVMETVYGPGGEVIAGAGSYLDEEQITACAAVGIWSMRVAPLTPTEMACAQLCGLGHYRMRGEVEVVPAPEYRAWVDAREEELRSVFGAGSGDGENPENE